MREKEDNDGRQAGSRDRVRRDTQRRRSVDGGAAEVAHRHPLFQFKPGQLAVTTGTLVAWTNHDDITHTVTSGRPDARDGRFQQRLEGKGSTITVDFNERGVYPYFCERHPSMRGEIRVN